MNQNQKIQQVIKILQENRKLAKSYLKGMHTQEFIDTTRGMISGYEFAIAVCKKALSTQFLSKIK